MTTVVVGGALAAKAGNAGNAWTRLSWVGAFRRLGFDVWFVEELPAGRDDATAAARAAALAWAAEIGERHDLTNRLLISEPGAPAVRDVVAESALVLNISGHLAVDALGGAAAHSQLVFLDDDPGFTQIWAATAGTGSRLDGHDLHLTFGANIGTPACALPTNDRQWHAVRPPVLLDEWPASPAVSPDRLTTVTSWRAPFGAVAWNGRTFPLKHHEFRKLFPLPGLVPASFAVAMPIDPAESSDLDALAAHGWTVSDTATVVSTTDGYREWIRGSGTEISAAHGVYAHTASGWISDRTAAYLASGRPAVVQRTGVEGDLATGEGLLTFDDVQGAAAGIRSVLADYERHAKAARALAEECFDAVAIASRVCELAGVAP